MEQLNKSVLVALFDLAQLDAAASVQTLAARLGVTRREVADSLSALDRQGLVRAEKVRLTMMGLVRAASLRQKRQKQSQQCAA